MTEKIIPNDLFFGSVEELLHEGQSVEIRVKGYSMRPFLRNERDTVRLRPTADKELQRGMVVLFRNHSHHTLHRLHKIDGERFTFKGDGNYRQSETVGREDIVAVVNRVVRGTRTFYYGSAEWRVRSFYSLTIKALRTAAIDIKHKLKI